MTYGALKRRLRRLGVELVREGRSHEVWRNPRNGLMAPIPRHRGEVPAGTLSAILRELGLTSSDLR
ncbi:MAG: type II toxin-antitoxin system HicA family toxin [SAR202 cluster bacterium]|nr:type II toxin-antitoxin system HicA family toxin [SAR202 cluster bacterium]